MGFWNADAGALNTEEGMPGVPMLLVALVPPAAGVPKLKLLLLKPAPGPPKLELERLLPALDGLSWRMGWFPNAPFMTRHFFEV
jgi:hypothetical protein